MNNCDQLCDLDLSTPKKYKCLCSEGYDYASNHCHAKPNVNFHCKTYCTAPNSFCSLKKDNCQCKAGLTFVTNYTMGSSACVPTGMFINTFV